MGPGAEFDLIRSLVGHGRPLPRGVVVGPGDDAAVFENGFVLTCDMTVEDVHFRRGWLSGEEIGYRAAAAALSDLAAMAALPVAALVAYALPGGEGRALVREIHAGVEEACRLVGAGVVGGDVTASPGPLVVDVAAVGRTDRPVLRSGARPGDELWVTGRLGAPAAAVSLLAAGRRPSPPLHDAYARPRPRTAEALWLARHAELAALIDLSDGLAGDAAHVAAASGVTVILEADAVPVHPAAAEGVGEEAAPDLALSGGEDYELLLAVRPGALGGVVDGFAEAFGVPLSRVGEVVERVEDGVLLRPTGGGAPVRPARGGFDHFRPGTE